MGHLGRKRPASGHTQGHSAEASGSSLQQAVKITVFLTDLSNFATVNEVMAEYFAQPYPARAALGVASLPLGAEVEADAVLIA